MIPFKLLSHAIPFVVSRNLLRHKRDLQAILNIKAGNLRPAEAESI